MIKYYKYSLKHLLLEDKYNFQRKAGSTGGLVANALFQFSPTIKVKRMAADGDDTTDMVVDIGSGYKAGTKADGTPHIEITNSVEADIEIGFEGKRIYLGSLIEKKFDGEGIKPGVYVRSLRFSTSHTRINDRIQRAMGLSGGKAMLEWEADISVGNEASNDANMSFNQFHKSMIKAMEGLTCDTEISRLEAKVPEIQRRMEGYQEGLEYNPEDISLQNRMREAQQDLEGIQQAISWIQSMQPAQRIRAGNLRIPNEAGVKYLSQIYKQVFGITFGWDGGPKFKGQKDKVETIKLERPIRWLEYLPQKNQDLSELLPQTSLFKKLRDVWPDRVKYPFDKNPTVFGPVRGPLGSLFDSQTPFSFTGEETLSIWESLGDDYFIFLNVQGEKEIARTVRRTSAPFPGVGYFARMAEQEELLFDQQGNPLPVDLVKNIPIPQGECFKWEQQPDGTNKIVAVPNMELRTFPLLSEIVQPSKIQFQMGKHQGTETARIFLDWSSWSWASVPGLPFSPRMMHIIKKYLISSEN